MGLYDNKIWPYLAAGLISIKSIRGHYRWVSDMVARAVIGTEIDNLILNNYEAWRDRQNGFFIIPLISRESFGTALTMEFWTSRKAPVFLRIRPYFKTEK